MKILLYVILGLLCVGSFVLVMESTTNCMRNMPEGGDVSFCTEY